MILTVREGTRMKLRKVLTDDITQWAPVKKIRFYEHFHRESQLSVLFFKTLLNRSSNLIFFVFVFVFARQPVITFQICRLF